MLTLVPETDPILTTPCQEFDFDNPPFDPVEFATKMVEAMYRFHGVGLAANQVGVPYRIFSMRGSPENLVLFNPVIVGESEQKIVDYEGCLSFPGIACKVRRAERIRMRFTFPSGETDTQMFTGLTARIAQHEMDHMEGEIFYRKASRYHREMALKKRNKGVPSINNNKNTQRIDGRLST